MNPQSGHSKLLGQAAKGDWHSFGEFYELHLNEIYRYIFFRVYDHDEAEDLTAKVFLDAWERLTAKGRKPKIKNVRAWIYRIAHNKVIDYYRANKLQTPLDDHLDKELPKSSFESEMDNLFDSQKLAQGVRQLPLNYQEVIILRFINQLSHAEVAEIMQITENHARLLQHRALAQMREILSEVDNHE